MSDILEKDMVQVESDNVSEVEAPAESETEKNISAVEQADSLVGNGVASEDKNDSAGELINTDRKPLDGGIDIKELAVKVSSHSLSKSDYKALVKILTQCPTCPMVNYRNPVVKDKALCRKCFLYECGLLTEIMSVDGKSHNENLGRLVSSLSSQIVVNKKKLSKSERYALYEDKWVNAKVKPTIKQLEEETGVSRRQIYRDFVDMGIKEKKSKKDAKIET